MKKLSYYEEITMNYINGNISDFKKQIRRLSKQELLTLESYMIRVYELDGNNILHRSLV